MAKRTMFNIVRDLTIIKSFGAQCHPSKSTKIVEV